MTTLPNLVSDDGSPALRAVAQAERNARRLAEVLWDLAGPDGCFCRVPPAADRYHDPRCSAARAAIVAALEK